LEQKDLTKRLMLALGLSFLVLVGSNYLFPKKQTVGADGNKTISQTTNNTQTSPAQKLPDAVSNSAAPMQKKQHSDISVIESQKFTYRIDQSGDIYSATLHEKKYNDANGSRPELFNDAKTLPLDISFTDATLNAEKLAKPYSASVASIDLGSSDGEVVLTQKLSKTTVSKRLKFYPDGHYDLEVTTTPAMPFFITPGHRPEVDHSMYLLVRGSLTINSKQQKIDVEDGDADEPVVVNDTTIASSFDRYVASMFYDFDTPFKTTIVGDKNQDPLPQISSAGSIKIHGYIGPKEYRVLENINPKLTNSIEFGAFTFLAKYFYKFMLDIYDYIPNWGWVIIVFTIFVKIVLFYPTYKGMMSMQKLKDLAPKMKELKEKYGKDPAKMNMKTMELYKKNGANPLGGCLPMLLQIPVFFSLYRVLLNADELQGAPWILWITDLSVKDPYYVLPILMGATMYLQQKITPNTMTDPMQKKIFQYFPVIMTAFFLNFPSGLVLYWLTNNILTILQQMYINNAYNNYKNGAK